MKKIQLMLTKSLWFFLFFAPMLSRAQTFQALGIDTLNKNVNSAFVDKNGNPVILAFDHDSTMDPSGNYNQSIKANIGIIGKDKKITYHLLDSLEGANFFQPDSSGNYIVGESFVYSEGLIAIYNSDFHLTSIIHLKHAKVISFSCTKNKYYFLIAPDTANAVFGKTKLVNSDSEGDEEGVLLLCTDYSCQPLFQSPFSLSGYLEDAQIVSNNKGALLVSATTFISTNENRAADYFYFSPQGKINWQKSFTKVGNNFTTSDILPDDNGNSFLSYNEDLGPGMGGEVISCIDSSGSVLWKKTIAFGGYCEFLMENGKLIGVSIDDKFYEGGNVTPLFTTFYFIDQHSGAIEKLNSLSGVSGLIYNTKSIYRIGTLSTTDYEKYSDGVHSIILQEIVLKK